MPCHHALDTESLCVYRCPTSLRELATAILSPKGLTVKEEKIMLTCVVCEEKPAVALDVDGERVCAECREIAADLLKHYPELSEPVECLTCGNLRCEDALCMAEREAAQAAQEADDEWDGPCANDTDDDRTTFDMSDDADALASAGWGTDEDYGYNGDD